MRWSHWLGVALSLMGAVAGAQQVYKSVDQQGKVIFSDKPPADAKSVTPVEIKPGPSEADVREAVARERALGQAASQVGKPRAGAGQNRTSGVADAKAELAGAERRLDEAKQIGPGDRKGTASGGSRLSEDYRQRVQAAEAAVEKARKRLKQAQAGGAR
jgi:hypothetical protein